MLYIYSIIYIMTCGTIRFQMFEAKCTAACLLFVLDVCQGLALSMKEPSGEYTPFFLIRISLGTEIENQCGIGNCFQAANVGIQIFDSYLQTLNPSWSPIVQIKCLIFST